MAAFRYGLEHYITTKIWNRRSNRADILDVDGKQQRQLLMAVTTVYPLHEHFPALSCNVQD